MDIGGGLDASDARKLVLAEKLIDESSYRYSCQIGNSGIALKKSGFPLSRE
jgi:hypothetical protein